MKLFGFGSGDGPDEAEKQRAAASLRAVEAGGLPLNAVDRLQEIAGKPFFTSNFSVSELVLTRECGFKPVGQVMGSSVYNIGWQWTPASSGSWYPSSQELEVVTAAHYKARHLALNRLRQEAALLGADGVVGVRLDMGRFEQEAGMLEFVAIGTAVRRTDAPPTQGQPFLSDLSGQDHWALREAGYRPVGFCLGNCTWYQVASYHTQQAQVGGFFGGSWQNQELLDYTQAVYTARELAMQRMSHEARDVKAEGIVGVTLSPHIEQRHVEQGENRPSRRDLIVSFTAIGTAIAHDPNAAPAAAPLPMIRLR